MLLYTVSGNKKRISSTFSRICRKNNENWCPKTNDIYFFINGEMCGESIWEEHSVDVARYELGNCFKSKEECEFAIEKTKVTVELKRFAEKNNKCTINWNDYTQRKYYIKYDVKDDVIMVFSSGCMKSGNTIYFSSQEIAKNAVDTIGTDRLKKYYFESEG